MKMGKRLLAGLLTAAMCLCLLCAVPAQAVDICFTAIDESVLKLTSESMPLWSDGVLYAPYTTFNEADNGLRGWEIQTSYNKSRNRITVFDTSRFLAFDLETGTCWDDLTGVAYSGGAILRGDRPYLPVETVCRHFGLTYNYREIEQGGLLRIKTPEAVISDTRFADAAENVLAHRLKEYHQSLGGAGTGGSETSQRPGAENPGKEHNADTYLALRCDDGEYLNNALNLLDNLGERAVFFITGELARQRTDLVMRILGRGHILGLQTRGESAQECLALLEQESKTLARHAFARTNVTLAPKPVREELEGQGWICWESTMELAPTASTGANYFSNRVISSLGSRTRDVYLEMELNADTLRVLPTLLLRLEDSGFEIGLPLETRI